MGSDEEDATQPLRPKRSSRTRTLSESSALPEHCEPRSSLTSKSTACLRRHPSQATMWYTTVPQAMVTHSIGSRHAPTRRSLRHSRMIVLSKNGHVPREYLPPVIERYRLGAVLSGAQVLIGLLLIAVTLWLVFWAPHLTAVDVSHYSGLMICLSGWIGMVLMICCRQHHPHARRSGCVYKVKNSHVILSLTLSIVSFAVCVMAFCIHSYHLYELYLSIPHCQQEPFRPSNSTPPWFMELMTIMRPNSSDRSNCICGDISYFGLSCTDVKKTLPLVLTGESALNFMALFFSVWFVFLVVCGRRTSSTIQSKDDGL